MEEESSSMLLNVESVVEFPTGTDTEMKRILGAELAVMGGGDSRAISIRAGEFAIRAVNQTESPLFLTICLVDEHQWPVAKDSPVLRVGPRRFSFALPAFVYGLTLPESCSEGDLKKLEWILMKYSVYEDCSGKEDDTTFCMAESETKTGTETEFWTWASSKIVKRSNELLENMGIRDAMTKVSADRSFTNVSAGTVDLSNRTQRAIRMSAISKLVSKALVRGAINYDFHVDTMGPTIHAKSAYASIHAYVEVVRAVETAGRSIKASACGGCTFNGRQMLAGAVRFWKFNTCGLALLLRAVAASASINAGKDKGPVVVADVIVEEKGEVAGGENGLPAGDGSGESCVSVANSVEKPMESCRNV
ncbi:uncharacterized protein LOC143849171 [Tasmannia lanceolata]|uniref:uncharacterized protein LOC143849171 n=1 Tax=Tasmannia lanceolata TaxID=3420 RepID=UPI0040633DC1